MNLNINPGVGARVQMLRPHLFELRVDRLNAFTESFEIILVSPVVRLHVLAPNRDQAHAEFSKDGRFVRSAVVAFVTKDARSFGESES